MFDRGPVLLVGGPQLQFSVKFPRPFVMIATPQGVIYPPSA